MTTLQRYLTQNQNHYNKLWRELENAKRTQNEANHIEDLCSLSEEARRQMREIPFPEFPVDPNLRASAVEFSPTAPPASPSQSPHSA